MSTDPPLSRPRYTAFISYSHADRAVARWLHRAIEGYRVPRRLRPAGAVGAIERLAPVFLDQDELSSSPDLGHSVRAALAESGFLIVVCSPAAARSRWVDEEVREFKTLGRDDRILCALAAGEPHAERRHLSSELECLPPALRYRVIDGVIGTDAAAEPLACDLRGGRRQRRQALLKLAAAMLDVPFDVLQRREHGRRQRRLAWVAAASAVSCVVFAGLAITAWLARNQAEQQRALAQQKSLTAERTTDFLVSLFKVSDPSEARGNSVTAREILDRGVRQVDESLRDEPAVRAELLATLGEVYTGLGLFGDADGLLSRAYEIPGQAPETTARQALARADLEFQRGDYPQADAYLATADERVRGSDADTPQLRARISLARGEVAAVQERADEARQYFEAALAANGANGLGSEVGVRAAEGLALTSYSAGDLDAAEREYLEAAAARRALSGETHPKVSDSLHQLGGIAYERGDTRKAGEYFEQALAVDTRILGPTHPNVAATMLNIGRLRFDRREFVTAAEILAEGVALIRAQGNELNPDLIFGEQNLGLAYAGTGDLGRASALLESALRAASASNHPLQGPLNAYLGDMACRAGAFREGLVRLDAALPLIVERYPDEPWRSAHLESVRADCVSGLGQHAAADQAIEASTPVLLTRWPVTSALGREAVERAVRVAERRGDQAAAARYRSAIAADAAQAEKP